MDENQPLAGTSFYPSIQRIFESPSVHGVDLGGDNKYQVAIGKSFILFVPFSFGQFFPILVDGTNVTTLPKIVRKVQDVSSADYVVFLPSSFGKLGETVGCVVERGEVVPPWKYTVIGWISFHLGEDGGKTFCVAQLDDPRIDTFIGCDREKTYVWSGPTVLVRWTNKEYEEISMDFPEYTISHGSLSKNGSLTLNMHPDSPGKVDRIVQSHPERPFQFHSYHCTICKQTLDEDLSWKCTGIVSGNGGDHFILDRNGRMACVEDVSLYQIVPISREGEINGCYYIQSQNTLVVVSGKHGIIRMFPEFDRMIGYDAAKSDQVNFQIEAVQTTSREIESLSVKEQIEKLRGELTRTIGKMDLSIILEHIIEFGFEGLICILSLSQTFRPLYGIVYPRLVILRDQVGDDSKRKKYLNEALDFMKPYYEKYRMEPLRLVDHSELVDPNKISL